MKERPILMSAFSVRAILDRRKTQTRRVIKNVPAYVDYFDRRSGDDGAWRGYMQPGEPTNFVIRGPWQSGDRLWVQEGYCFIGSASGRRCEGVYTADDSKWNRVLSPDEWEKWNARKYPLSPTSGRFMYRSLSRLTPEVLSVHPERLQDTTNEDAIAEGMIELLPVGWRWEENGKICSTPRLAFANLWNSIYAKRGLGWHLNPWVWVITFDEEGLDA